MDDEFKNLSSTIESKVNEINAKITLGMKSRGYRAANELRNASQQVLRGKRSGRRYRVPGTRRMYTASAPGEPPAIRTGTFRNSWQAKTESSGTIGNMSVRSYIESSVRTDNGKYSLGKILEEGSPGGKIAPRPYKKKIQEKALPRIKKIYREPYL